jgi:pilus assembly protein CpaB
MKQRVILIASVVIGLVAALLTRQYLNAKDREVERKLQELTRGYTKILVLVVQRDLPAGSVLGREDIGALPMIESAVRGHVIKADEVNVNMVLNRRLIRPLQKGSPVSWSDIEGGDPVSRGLSDDVQKRMRAISIGVGGTAAVSGMVRPSDHVDVIGTFTFPSASKPGEMEMVTLTIMQDVLVLATGQETAKTLFASGNRGAGGYSAVTLEVTPREAEMLVFAEQARGRLVLTLRNRADVYYEKDLPRVDFARIQEEISTLNAFRQETLLRKRGGE